MTGPGGAGAGAGELERLTRAGDARRVGALLVKRREERGATLVACACLAAQLGHAGVLGALLGDTRLRELLWSKREIDATVGEVDLGGRGLTRTVYVVQEVLHHACEGGSEAAVEALLGSLSASELRRLVRKEAGAGGVEGKQHRASSASPEEGGSPPDAGGPEEEAQGAGPASAARPASADLSTVAPPQAGGLLELVFDKLRARASDERAGAEIAAVHGHLALLRHLTERRGFALEGAVLQRAVDGATRASHAGVVRHLLGRSPSAKLRLACVCASGSPAMLRMWAERPEHAAPRDERNLRAGCDMCGASPIVGVRYKSVSHSIGHYTQFDACESCVEKPGAWERMAKGVADWPLLRIANATVYQELESAVQWLDKGDQPSAASGAASADASGPGASSLAEQVTMHDALENVPSRSRSGTLGTDGSVGRAARAASSGAPASGPRRGLLGRLLCRPGSLLFSPPPPPSPPLASSKSRSRSRLSSSAGGHRHGHGQGHGQGRVEPSALLALAMQHAVKMGCVGTLKGPGLARPGVAHAKLTLGSLGSTHGQAQAWEEAKQVLLCVLLRVVFRRKALLELLRDTRVEPTWLMQGLFLWLCKEERDTALPLLQLSPDLLGLSAAQAQRVAHEAHSSALFFHVCSAFQVRDASKEFDLLFAEGRPEVALELLAERESAVDLRAAAARSVLKEIRERKSSYLGDAIFRGYDDLARALLAHPDVRAWEPHNDPLWSACKIGNLEMVDLLLRGEGLVRAGSDGEHDAVCNKCGDLIDGTRYKCTRCFDFDLCFACMRKGAAQSHSRTHDESSMVALRDAIFWEGPRAAIHAGHVHVARRLFQDPRFLPFPVFFMYAVKSADMTSLMLELCAGPIEDLDGDMIVSQAALHPPALKALLQDPRFEPSDNALLTAVVNGVDESASTLLATGFRFASQTFHKAMPFLLAHKRAGALLETVLRSLPDSGARVDLAKAIPDDEVWRLVDADRLRRALHFPALQPRSEEQALRLLEAAIVAQRPALVELWLTEPPPVGPLARNAASQAHPFLAQLAARLPSSTQATVVALLKDADKRHRTDDA